MNLRLALLSLAAVAATSGVHAASLNPDDTSVQMFEWGWNDIAYECREWLGPQGYGAVQISPAQASKSVGTWWDVYQPVDYRSLSSRFGDEAAFKGMIDSCHSVGVRIYADVVVNQMADGSSAAQGQATDGAGWDAASLAYPAFSAYDFHTACVIQDADYGTPAGRANVQDCRLNGLPDLNHESWYVRGQVQNYLVKLLDLGVDGFRIDAAKHIAPASLKAELDAVRQARPVTKMGESFWVTQEVIPDGEVVRADYFANGSVNEFLFTYLMRDAWRNWNGTAPDGIPAAMGSWGAWGGNWNFVDPRNATVFVGNWDTERSGASLSVDDYTGQRPNDTVGSHRYDLANIFMLAQGYGQAQLYSGFRYNNVDQNRPGASPYQDGVARINIDWDFVHRWRDISNMVRFRSAMRNQPQQGWTTDNPNHIAFARGSVGFVALNNTRADWSRRFHTGLPAGVYCNVVNGESRWDGGCEADTVTVDANGDADIRVPADSDQTVPAVAIYTSQKAR